MTNEQREAIKYFKNFTKYTIQLAKEEESVNGRTIYQKDIEKRGKYLDTVLSLIQEQDEAIQNYQKITAKNTIKTLKDELLQEKNKEIEIYKKMIEVMADCIAFGGKVHFGEPEKVIIYFKKKAISAILQEKEEENDNR